MRSGRGSSSLTIKPATLCRSENYFRIRKWELTSTIRILEPYIWAGSDMRLSEFAAKMKDELLAIEKEMLKRETQYGNNAEKEDKR
jgi:hypothetical protein